jgi:diguanylate cyclase (GGDEF)-like protein
MDTDLRARLESKGLFQRIDVGVLEHLLDECDRRIICAGATLLEPHTENDSLYVVLSGELRVYLHGSDLPAHSLVGVGECVGELSLIDGQGVSAVVVAASDSELLVVPQEMLWALVERSHGFARNLLAILSGRIRNDNLALVTTASRSLEFEQAASVDALTGLHNRRWLADAFMRSIRRCAKDGAPLCLVMADIDHFKRLNDQHGHLMGDAVLQAVARRLTESLRAPDLIARYGGDEFAILLPRTATEEGQHIAERLRASVERMSLTNLTGGAVSTITISCGIAPLAQDTSLDNLISTADSALYRAKAGGRNRVEVAV